MSILPDFLKISSLEPTVLTIQGREIKFYPVRARHFLKYKGVATKLFPALREAYYDRSAESGSRVTENQRGPESYEREVTVIPTDPTLAKQKMDSRADQTKTIVDMCLSEEGALLLAELVVNSARDTFEMPNGGWKADHYAEVIDGMDLATFAKMVGGAIQASAGLFGSKGKKLAEGAVMRLLPKTPSPEPSSDLSEKDTSETTSSTSE